MLARTSDVVHAARARQSPHGSHVSKKKSSWSPFCKAKIAPEIGRVHEPRRSPPRCLHPLQRTDRTLLRRTDPTSSRSFAHFLRHVAHPHRYRRNCIPLPYSPTSPRPHLPLMPAGQRCKAQRSSTGLVKRLTGDLRQGTITEAVVTGLCLDNPADLDITVCPTTSPPNSAGFWCRPWGFTPGGRS